jgi:putative inorganic carbon (hco3(-)) transporter
VSYFGEFLQSAVTELPAAPSVRWASIFFTLSVWTYLVSLAASQTFLALAAAGYAAYLLRHKAPIRFPPVKLPLLLFCALTVTSVIRAAGPTPGWFAVRKLVLFLILLFATNLVVSRRHLEVLLKGLFIESALAAVVGIGQFVSRYRASLADHPDQLYRLMAYDERIQGLMGHWMNFSGQQMLVFAALLALVLLERRRSRLWWVVLAVVAISIVLSLTRGVWAGCFVAALYILCSWRPRWLLAIPVSMVFAYAAAPHLLRERIHTALHPRSDMALSIRFEMWQVGLRMMRAHPWLGVGPDDVERDYWAYLPSGRTAEFGYHGHLHNNFVQLGAERGLPALAAWLWLMGVLGWRTFRIARRLPARRWIAHGALACWLALLAEGCFEFNFGTSPVLMLFLFLAASPFVVEQLELQPAGTARASPAEVRRGVVEDSSPG